MARTPTVSQSEALDAITDLISAGQYPTHARVREALDNRGSPVVLQRYIGEWYRLNGPRLAGNAAPPPQAELDAGIRGQLESATKTALGLLDEELSRRERKLGKREAELEAYRALLDGQERELAARSEGQQLLIDKLTRDLAKAEEATVAARVAAADSDQALGNLRQELAALEAAYSALASERDALTKDRDSLSGRLNELSGDHAAADAALVEARARVLQLEAQLASADERYSALQSELDRAHQAQGAAERDARRELVAATERFVATQEGALEERKRMVEALAAAQTALEDCQTGAAALDRELAQARATAAAAVKQRDDLAKLLAAQQEAAVATERSRDRLEEVLSTLPGWLWRQPGRKVR